jgi:hypothetical protein
MSDRRSFLTARWRHLVMLNFAVDPDCLTPLAPLGTELDDFDGRYLVSVVAFEFAAAKLFGLRVPGYQLFPEVNLRFYVRRWIGGRWRRGVVFIKELVPRRLVAGVARYVFGQNFASARMFHHVGTTRQGQLGHAALCPRHPVTNGPYQTSIRYRWTVNDCACHVSAKPGGQSDDPEHAFVAQHYYAYAKSGRRSVEYRVEHPPWRIYQASDVSYTLHGSEVYGEPIGRWLLQPPSSVLIADGSEVAVYREESFTDSAKSRGRENRFQPVETCRRSIFQPREA